MLSSVGASCQAASRPGIAALRGRRVPARAADAASASGRRAARGRPRRRTPGLRREEVGAARRHLADVLHVPGAGPRRPAVAAGTGRARPGAAADRGRARAPARPGARRPGRRRQTARHAAAVGRRSGRAPGPVARVRHRALLRRARVQPCRPRAVGRLAGRCRSRERNVLWWTFLRPGRARGAGGLESRRQGRAGAARLGVSAPTGRPADSGRSSPSCKPAARRRGGGGPSTTWSRSARA